MASRRCSTCAINWPLGVGRCQKCGGETWHSQENDPDPNPDVEATADDDYEVGTPGVRIYNPDVDAKIVSWRELSFLRLDFEPLNARALAMRRDIDREDVATMRAAGCAPELIMDIVL